MLNTYLGQKGYTLHKAELTPAQQKQIKEDLTISPLTMGSYGPNNQVKFPVYRESSNKIYVPHYYGVNNFGKPNQNKIPEGDEIHLTFNGTLRDYQIPVVEKYITYVMGPVPKGGLLELPCAWGKTSASLYILSKLKKKTLVIVHKEFLMNQWIERIEQFLPGTRVGKIQGQTIDIENKDIVLCMLQSLVLKEYPSSLFDSFGLTIIDEVHHISSQTFSTALFKVVTKYMLGLSATMDRKDGTTKVFKMFLGEVVYKAEKKNDYQVEVRAITYKTTDPDFNETILDFKGQPQISSMISKLCSYNRRTEFIIQTLNDYIRVDMDDVGGVTKDIIKTQTPSASAYAVQSLTFASQHKEAMDKANPCCKICNKNDNYLVINTCCNVVNYCLPCMEKVVEAAKICEVVIDKKTGLKKEVKRRAKCPSCSKVLAYEQHYIENPYVKPLTQVHTIIMSHNLNILEYMYKKIVCKNYASVGYYVGGMNEAELKKTEKKQVILASYSMAQEGLDISTLNTEFLISPKTDVVQIVGRILRAKHATTIPTIYDFVDSHDVFQRQWLKRKAYYKKQSYRIIGTNSIEYDGLVSKNNSLWNVMYEPGLKKQSNKGKEKDKEEDVDEESKDPFLSGKCLIKFGGKGK
uniref:Helicase ATP-binding domain-containing protein n=1 Tax=viral metagenome TaxID=1070528 RepID=A0A6C0EWV5_9ZZZZ